VISRNRPVKPKLKVVAEQAQMYQFMRDLTACMDWYDKDSGCILSRDELCDIINFLAAN